ncbi:MAG: RIP metalloprotease RseP [Flavobacteriales bacterium]|nr:RIP metalloprotease RseP [Flavobacteriales bacterium]
MEFLIKAAQLILSLSILVVLHELGHFIPARLFKTRVEKFFLFFDPWFALWKKKVGDTVYGIGWLPLGGYVKISGMVDESMDKDQMARPPEPWEFRSKPAWQRLIIMVGGVTVNLLLGLFLYTLVLFVWGREYLPLERMTWGVHPAEVMQEQGFRDGDKILSVGEHEVKALEDVGKAILIDGERSVTVGRDGELVTLTLDGEVHELILEKRVKSLFTPCIPFVIDSIVQGKNAEKSGGFRKGDRVMAVDTVPTPYFADFVKAVKDRKGKSVVVGVERAGAGLVEVTVDVDENGQVGLGNQPLDKLFELEREHYSLAASIPAGIRYGVETLGGYVSSLKLLFTRSGAQQIGGFGAIGSLFSPVWDWQRFWEMTAFLSIVLAFMNILPIPALDGGHVLFLLYEMVTRRTPSQKVLEYAQMVGMVLLLGLVLFANGNDLFRWISGK